MDGAQLSCQIRVDRGNTSRIFQVDAYPTKHTREITNNQKDGISPGVNAVRQCRWSTVGVIQFYMNPETRLIYKTPKESAQLEITLKHCFDDIIKEELAKRAKELYGLDFTSANFEICPFKKFIAQLNITLDGTRKTYFGTLLNPRQLSPIRIIFSIDDSEALSKIALKLKEPSKHHI
ncbi:unnamed protein product [Didymodactylos carnosus]|uniref:Uncharacterized protein n=1 Tax=Didymodactylos carnosus TaxID=1234261 RepID=A0A8S2JZS1_9BILA|nr:unnamed protein product [Didymodactylos carnosus]CAF3832813.1 unnamed protein product [Didymodactylos carnosus]